MLIDGIELMEGSEARNLTVARGTSYPADASEGELFYNDTLLSLCVFKAGDWVEIGAVRTVAGRAGDVVLAVEDVERALSSDLLNVPNGIPTLNALGYVPDEQLNTYNKTQIDEMVATASTNQYHSTPYDIASAIVNKPSGSAKVLRFVAAMSKLLGSLTAAAVTRSIKYCPTGEYEYYTGYHVKKNGDLYACGLNNYGQYGINTTTAVYTIKSTANVTTVGKIK